MKQKLNTRAYTSVAVFSADLAKVLSSDLGVEVANTAELQQQVSGRATDMTAEQRERRKLAKRIVKAVQPALEQALRNESELNGRPYEKQIRELDMMLDHSILSRRDSFACSANEDGIDLQFFLKPPESHDAPPNLENRESAEGTRDVGVNVFISSGRKEENPDGAETNNAPIEAEEELDESIAQLNGELSADAELIIMADTPPASTSGMKGGVIHAQVNHAGKEKASAPAPPTPPLSLEGLQQPSLTYGGIPWYVEPFDPDGTTTHEERWTGPEVLREMSEELTDIDDEELQGLGNMGYVSKKQEIPPPVMAPATPAARNPKVKKNGKLRRRWRGFR